MSKLITSPRAKKVDPSQETASTYVVFCPTRLCDDQNLSDGAVCTYLVISNFLNKDGYAFCSNEWLSTRRKQEIRQIRRHLEELEERGYIYREIFSKGFTKDRRIWLTEKYAAYLLAHGKKDSNFNPPKSSCPAPQELSNKKDSTTYNTDGVKNLWPPTSPCSVSSDKSPSSSTNKKLGDTLKKCLPQVINYRSEGSIVTAPERSNTPPIIEKSNIQVEQTNVADAPSLLFSHENKIEIQQESLPLFHSSRKYLKGLSEDDRKQVQFYYEKQKSTIKNPIPWLTKCVEGKWYKEEMLSDEDLQQNFQFSRKIEDNFTKLGFQGIDSYCYSDPKRIVLVKGGKEIPSPSYGMGKERFKSLLTNTIIDNFNNSDKILQ